MLPVALAAALATAAAGAYERYQVESETTCAGDPDHAFAQADSWSAAGHRFTVRGGRAEVRREGAVVASAGAAQARLGLLAAVKDFSPETRDNLAAFAEAFRRAGVAGIVVGGDSAYGVDDQDTTLTEVFSFLGGQGLPVYAVIGNSESRGAFNRSLLAAFRQHRNVVNLDLVRRVDGDGFTLVSLPGYYDQRYIHESAGCRYQPDDAAALVPLARDAPAPVVMVSHGPPRQGGKLALDATSDGANVGDLELLAVLQQAKIRFGVFGHILEAGGRATDLSGRKSVKPNVPAAELFVNPGPAFADPWPLHGGATSHGMAAILTLRNGMGQWLPLAPKVTSARAPVRVLWR